MTPIPCLGPKACSPGCRDYGRTAVSCEPYGTASTDERLWGQDHPLCPEQTNHIQKLVDTGHSSPGPRTARGSLWNCPPLSLTRHCALCPVLRKSVPSAAVVPQELRNHPPRAHPPLDQPPREANARQATPVFLKVNL